MCPEKVSALTALMYSVLRTEGLVGKRVFDLFGNWLEPVTMFSPGTSVR